MCFLLPNSWKMPRVIDFLEFIQVSLDLRNLWKLKAVEKSAIT